MSRFLRRGPAWIRAVAAGLLGLTVAAALIGDIAGVTRWEAMVNGWLMRMFGVTDAHHVGSAVVFPDQGRWVGFVITGGWSVVLPLLPPILIG